MSMTSKTLAIFAILVSSSQAQASKLYTINDLGTLPGFAYSQGFSVNYAGLVTGVSNKGTPIDVLHAFVTDNDNHLIDLGTLGGSNSIGYGINGKGQVTGWADTSGDAAHINGLTHAFVTDSSNHMIDLGTLGGTFSYGAAINASGLVTGYSNLAGDTVHHAFVTDGNTLLDLNSLLLSNAANWVLMQGIGINDVGQITGYGSVNNQTHAFLLSPVDAPTVTEPGIFWLLGAGFAGWTCVHSRRRIQV